MKTEVGFMGWSTINPSYEDVCYNLTGHVEVVQVTFDPSIVNYSQLLKVFLDNHDITAVREALSQYRSVIFYDTPEQMSDAKTFVRGLSDSLQRKMQVGIEPTKPFYKAAKYHQKYYDNHGWDRLSSR